MPITDVLINGTRPSDKALRLFDGGGLYLEVVPSGSKYWRLKYRYAGREKRLALGVYPETGLKLARQRRDDARRLLSTGVDPGAARLAQKNSRKTAAANTFEPLAREWFATRQSSWVALHAAKNWHRIEKNLLPWIGKRPITEITAPELLLVLRRGGEPRQAGYGSPLPPTGQQGLPLCHRLRSGRARSGARSAGNPDTACEAAPSSGDGPEAGGATADGHRCLCRNACGDGCLAIVTTSIRASGGIEKGALVRGRPGKARVVHSGRAHEDEAAPHGAPEQSGCGDTGGLATRY